MAVIEYFSQQKRFHLVIPLHAEKEMSWEKARAFAPSLPKGWWEFSKLEEGVKLEFMRDFWFNALPYLPHIYHFLDGFFAKVKELGVYLAQKNEGGPFTVFLSYSLQGRFFLGNPPLLEKEIERVKRKTAFPLPRDFLNFLRVHNGFTKGEDKGVFSTFDLSEEEKFFRQRLEGIPEGISLGEEIVPHKKLFPFYKSFALDIYQCFYKDWYPDGEVGNVRCLLSEKMILSSKEEKTVAFPSFLDWLIFYLE